MKKLLPLGSVVKLKNGEQKIMIISRLPLYNNEGTIGYFDYGACLYPNGQVDQQMYFFNETDIDKVLIKCTLKGMKIKRKSNFKRNIKKKLKI